MGSHADADADERRAATGHAPIPARLRGAAFAPRANALIKGGAVEALCADEHKLDTQLRLDFRCDVRLASRTVAVLIIKKDWSLVSGMHVVYVRISWNGISESCARRRKCATFEPG